MSKIKICFTMFKPLFLSLLITISYCSISAQKILSVDLTEIKENISDITSPNYYPTLLSKFSNLDTTLTPNQLYLLYYGKYFQTFYQPAEIPKNQNDMFKSLSEKDFSAALVYGKRAFDIDPLDLKTLFGISLCHYYLHNETEMDKYLHMYYSLLSVIVASGDGKKPESAMVVMSVSDEYEVISDLGAVVTKQKTLKSKTDLLYIKKKSDEFDLQGLKKLYFNIEIPILKSFEE